MTYLDLSDNTGIAQLDLSANTALVTVDIASTKVSKLNLTSPEMETLIADKGFYLNDVSINDAAYVHFTEDKLIAFMYENATYYISCMRNESVTWSEANGYWSEQGLRLPTKEEAGVIYNHKSELSAFLSSAGYTDNYFQSSDTFWTSSTSSSSHYYLYMNDGTFGSYSYGVMNKDSFGIYVK